MTREEKLTAMRSKDLVIYAQNLGVKVSQSHGMLKEARAGVIQRILAAENKNMEVQIVDELIQEFMEMSDTDCVGELFEKVHMLSPESQSKFMEKLNKIANN